MEGDVRKADSSHGRGSEGGRLCTRFAFLFELFAVLLVQHHFLDAVLDVINLRFVQLSSIFSLLYLTTNVSLWPEPRVFILLTFRGMNSTAR